jgi:hypothetical protein
MKYYDSIDGFNSRVIIIDKVSEFFSQKARPEKSKRGHCNHGTGMGNQPQKSFDI